MITYSHVFAITKRSETPTFLLATGIANGFRETLALDPLVFPQLPPLVPYGCLLLGIRGIFLFLWQTFKSISALSDGPSQGDGKWFGSSDQPKPNQIVRLTNSVTVQHLAIRKGEAHRDGR